MAFIWDTGDEEFCCDSILESHVNILMYGPGI